MIPYVMVIIFIGFIVFLMRLYLKYAMTRGAKNYKHVLARRSAGAARNLKDCDYNRELPFGDSIASTFSALHLVQDLPQTNVILGALILEWIRIGVVQLYNGPDGLCVWFPPNEPALCPQEAALYQILLQASGENRLLEPEELKRWSEQNPERVQQWLREYDDLGLYELHHSKVVETRLAYRPGVSAKVAEQSAKPLPPPSYPGEKPDLSHAIEDGQAAVPLWLLEMNTNVYFTAAGRAALSRAYGFCKYLKDFTVLEERLPQEVQLWQRYLVYAQLYGNATAVAKSFQKTYPDAFASEASSQFLQAILGGVTDAIDRAWIDVFTKKATSDPLGTRK